MRALERHLPALARHIPFVDLGVWPTPMTMRVVDGAPLWIKHEGDSAPAYGGNKVRTLEAWFGHARDRGATKIWSIGAYGSNHVLATAIHGPRAGLDVGSLLFPQPSSPWALDNCGALIATSTPIVCVRTVAIMPMTAYAIARRERHAMVMPPGGATPIGTFGAVSAAFELADQIYAGLAPPPSRIVLAVGSTCTTAGLLAGVLLAKAANAWPWPLPIIHGVRVTPWPVTSRVRIAVLAARTLARVRSLGQPGVDIDLRVLLDHLVIDRHELGAGYGRTTPRCEAAMRSFPELGLDGVYSAKAASALLRLHRTVRGPLVFWATKATSALARPSYTDVRAAPRALQRWLR